MFFARLAVAALTFGSFTQVFSAPIAVDTGIVAIDTKVVDVDHIRRGEPVNFLGAVSKMGGTAQEIQQALGVPNVNTESVAPKMAELLSDLTAVAGFLEAPLTDVNMIMVDVGGVKTVAEDVVGENLKAALVSVNAAIVKVISLKTLRFTVEQVKGIEVQVLQIKSGVETIVPTLVPFVSEVLGLIVVNVGSWSNSLGVTVTM